MVLLLGITKIEAAMLFIEIFYTELQNHLNIQKQVVFSFNH
jgi:hypothetical protein